MQFKHQLTHDPYKQFVKDNLMKLFFSKEIKSIVRFAPFIVRLFLLNLDPLRDLLIPTYNKPNHQPTDPAALFRSLLLMTFGKEASVTKWVDRLEESKVHAILSVRQSKETQTEKSA
jgi:hypothetical protein